MKWFVFSASLALASGVMASTAEAYVTTESPTVVALPELNYLPWDDGMSYTLPDGSVITTYYSYSELIHVDPPDMSFAVYMAPLPASAPMFGAGLLAFGAFGCAIKRKMKALAFAA